MFVKFENRKNGKGTDIIITYDKYIDTNKCKAIKNISSKNIQCENQLSLKDKFNDIKFKIKSNLKKQREIQHFKDRWLDIMYQCGFYNKYNQTYTLLNVKQESFGYSCIIAIPDGYSANMLSDKTEVIQNNIECTLILKKYTNKRFINARFVLIEDCNSIAFEPIKVKPYEILGGVNEAGEPIIFNVNIEPQMLVAGATRSGKNGCLDHSIPSWIYYCSEKEVNLYLFQFAKGDLGKYKRCKQVKSFVLNNLNKMSQVLYSIIKEMKHRTKLLQPMLDEFKGDNLFDYNKLHPDKKLPYIYVIIDEFMKIADISSKDDDDIKETKKIILKCLQDIAEFGGAYGVNYIIAHQKPEAKLMPTFLKNQSNIRVCFGFKDEVCGRIVLGEGRGNLVVGLPPRKAYYISNSSEGYLYTTNLRNEDNSSRILGYIKDNFQDIYEENEENYLFNNEDESFEDNNYNESHNKEEKDLEILRKVLNNINKIQEYKKNVRKKVVYNKPIQGTGMTLINIPKKDADNQKNKSIVKVNQSKSIIPISNKDIIKDAYTKQPEEKIIVPDEIIVENKNIVKINQNNRQRTTNKSIKKIQNNIQLEFDNVNDVRTKEDILLENIKKIPGFVPYEPPNINNKKGE